MASYGKRSAERLATSHKDLQVIFNEVVIGFDCSILCGHRNEADQNAAFSEGRSKVKWPTGKHNSTPSQAIDAAPYPIDWKDINRFYMFGGYVLATADRLYREGKIAHRLRWGGDWDLDTEVNDQRFNDLPHFELINPNRNP